MTIKNSWIGVGRIAQDLELRVTESGKKVLNFNIAVDDGTRDNPHTTFVPIEAWEKTAEVVQQYFKKGDQIIVGGRLAVRQSIDRGEKRNRISVVLESFEWGAKKKTENKETNNVDAMGSKETNAVETMYLDDIDAPWAN